jgi:hypothetical protein
MPVTTAYNIYTEEDNQADGDHEGVVQYVK